MTYEITIDESKVPGITAAREAYNASLPPTHDEEGNAVLNPGFLTNDEYVQFVMEKAAESYCNQYGV